jgi:hypothetical protein
MTRDDATDRSRMFAWEGVGAWRAEVATVHPTGSGLNAYGTQLGASPFPYRLHYELEALRDWVTDRLWVRVETPTSRRSVELTHDGSGSWRCEAELQGDDELPPPGGDTTTVDGAMDCDLGFSPLTNVMPIRRNRLHTDAGGGDFVMAWISVPDLRLVRSEQRYDHVRADGTQAVVHYVGRHRGFTGELVLDAEGFVMSYPEMARLVSSV